MTPLRAQSAMEYLTTYGWAIIVIAVVVVSLAAIGVFNPLGLGPKAAPGACQIQRPYGVGTVQFINLIGTCTGELPQFAAYFNGNTATANVVASSTLTSPFSSNAITVAAWFKVYNIPNSGFYTILDFGTTGGVGCIGASLRVQASPNQLAGLVQTLGGGQTLASNSISTSTWYYGAMTATSNNLLTLYINGQFAGSNTMLNTFDTPGQVYNLVIGSNLGSSNSGSASCGGGPYYFNGTISNVQIYNTALSANDINALYMEGIGGAPIDLQHIQAWYQMNQNVFDYSGNLNNATSANVVYLSNWQTGYTVP